MQASTPRGSEDYSGEDAAVQAVAAGRPEVRAATRTAAAALAVSFVAACFVGTTLVMDKRLGMPSGLFWTSTGRTVTLHEQGRITVDEEAAYGFSPAPHHLVVASTLREDPSLDAKAIQVVSAGRQVYPVGSSGTWVQVVVAAMPDSEGGSAGFGWLPLVESGVPLLERDTEVRHRKRPQGPPPTPEEVEASLQQARARTAILQATVEKLQSVVRDVYVKGAQTAAEGVGQAAVQGVQSSFTPEELQAAARDIRKGVHEGMRAPPAKLVDRLSSTLAE